MLKDFFGLNPGFSDLKQKGSWKLSQIKFCSKDLKEISLRRKTH
jgi:hypothetical protein